jgi:hypothetical protein
MRTSRPIAPKTAAINLALTHAFQFAAEERTAVPEYVVRWTWAGYTDCDYQEYFTLTEARAAADEGHIDPGTEVIIFHAPHGLWHLREEIYARPFDDQDQVDWLYRQYDLARRNTSRSWQKQAYLNGFLIP